MNNMLITGAASGIGRASAIRMSRHMHVVAADRDKAGVDAVVAEIKSDGREASAVEFDVTSSDSVRRMMAWVGENVGPIHAAFNCAGINRRGAVDEITEEVWDQMMDTHVKGTYLVCQAVLPGMIENGKGAIVNMSSDYAIMGVPGGAAYCAAKAAVYSLTKSLADEFTSSGIRANALGPGPIDTPILKSGRTEEEWKAVHAMHSERLPIGRLGQPAEVAAVLDFLISDRSSYINGQIIHPNGGQLSW